MKRVIKFRAWDGQNMFVSPSLAEGSHHLGSWFEAHSILHSEFGKQNEIMQYTGLIDKNGIEIYEGDIIELNGKYRYKVVFEDAKFVCYHITKVEWGRWGDLKRLSDPDFSDYHYEVIGNVYQNPELSQ